MSSSVLQIADVALRVVFWLFLLCCWPLFYLVPAVVFTLETSEASAILVFTTKTTQSRPQVFSVNGALTCRRLHFWRHFLVKHKILLNLVIRNWLWWIMRVLLANQELGKYFEWINWFKLGRFLLQERWIYFSGEFCWYFDKSWNKTQRKRLIWRLEISYGKNCFISMFIYNVNRFTFPAVSRDVSSFFLLKANVRVRVDFFAYLPGIK